MAFPHGLALRICHRVYPMVKLMTAMELINLSPNTLG